MNNKQDLMCECGHERDNHANRYAGLEVTGGVCMLAHCRCNYFQPATKPSEDESKWICKVCGIGYRLGNVCDHCNSTWNQYGAAVRTEPIAVTSPYHTHIMWTWNAMVEYSNKHKDAGASLKQDNYWFAKWAVDELEKVASEKDKRIQQLEERIKELTK